MRFSPARWLRRSAAFLAAAAAVLAFLVISPAGASAAPDTSAWYVVKSRSSGLVFEIEGGSTATGAGLVQNTRTDAQSQQFRFIDAGGGYYRIQARHSGQVLDVWGKSLADGATIAQYTDQNSTNQQWQVQESGGYATFISRLSGKALDVWERSTTPGTRISQYTANGGTNQQFQLIPVDDDGGSGGGLEGCTGTSPVSCRYDVAPGTYDVTVVLGGATAGSTTVTAETRRTMLGTTVTAAGQQVTKSFTVNVRTPEGQPTGSTGNPGLNLYFGGSAPRVSSVTVTPARQPQLFLAGDSTVCDQSTRPYTGWGQQLPQYFDQGLSVANYADSGDSSGSFLSDSRLFPTMKPLIRPGDVVLIQFGHNDKQTSASTFRSNLTRLIDGVKAQGGVPVLVTPIVRRSFNSDGTLNNGTALHVNGVGVDLPREMRNLAAAQGVDLIDLTALTKQLVERLGPEGSKALYLTNEASDNTHTSEYGADQFAQLVRNDMRNQGIVPAGLFR
ncbi:MULTISPECIES: RICIN domain-containing protein [Glycomyces]|uniref:Lysophospholipase L1-like esterase n=2 Tax=Glycomyces TaxID=58113 RepID=A0A9X3PLA5_9ACTN|nr:RICIN domain-containing protein [Glycomyces lechevalierae]MDA1386014.1 RICIN domain-containing protein [Glycomyces lechevalierae]MDR7340829.1 lysophospholipase L1-like esterase [Glycomyces lechevalierae]